MNELIMSILDISIVFAEAILLPEIAIARISIVTALLLFVIIGCWETFEKAKLPGRGILIPIYNVYLIFKLAGKPGAWVRWLLFPPVSALLLIIAQFYIAEKFGKSAGYGIGLRLLPFVFYPILGFGKAKYEAKK